MKTFSLDVTFGFETPRFARDWFIDGKAAYLNYNRFVDSIPGWDFELSGKLFGVSVRLTLSWV